MKVNRRQALAGTAASAAALATGVFRPAIAQSDPIRIGYLPALTGPSSSTGIGINRGTELAVKEINAAGGIKGRQLELIVRDTQSDPTKAVNASTELTRRHKVHVMWGWKGGVVLEADWNGRVLWEVRQPDHHHDGIRLRNGNVLLICLAQLPQHLVSQVKGGRPGTEHNGDMYADYLVEMTTDGRVVWDWRTWEHLDPAKDCITAVQDLREAWTHANGLAEMPNGDIVVSFRNISTVIIIDRKTGEIIWKLGAPPLSGQHAPMPLPNGNLLLFDNGPHRLDHTMTFSRIIEVDLATKQIVWKYQEKREYEFYSPRISNARRLPNGNTLVCEGDFGRFFEVTTEGELVWEYINPYFGEGPNGMNNRVFRAYRYSVEEIAKAKATGGTQ